MPELVHRRHQVEERFDVLGQFRERANDHRHDQLGRDELPERQLFVHHQIASQPEQRGAGQCLDGEEAQNLSQQDSEVTAPGGQIIGGEPVSARQCEVGTARQSEGQRTTSDIFQPSQNAVLLDRLANGRPRSTPPHHEDHKQQERQQQQVIAEQKRMIEREQCHPDDRRQHDRQSIDQQSGHDLLDRGDIEKAVDQLGTVRLPQRLKVGTGQS